jgi:hypothetical protein
MSLRTATLTVDCTILGRPNLIGEVVANARATAEVCLRHPQRARNYMFTDVGLSELADALWLLFQTRPDRGALEDAIWARRRVAEAWMMSRAGHRVNAVKLAALLAARSEIAATGQDEKDLAEALALAQSAWRIRAAGPRADALLAGWPELAVDAAAAQLAAARPERAVEILEQGRVLMWSQLVALSWRDVTGPVLSWLADHGQLPVAVGELPRVWWCPAGRFAQLPVHAAGLPGRPGESVPARDQPALAAPLRRSWLRQRARRGQRRRAGGRTGPGGGVRAGAVRITAGAVRARAPPSQVCLPVDLPRRRT